MANLSFIRLVAFIALLLPATTFSLPKLTTAPAGGPQQSARPWPDSSGDAARLFGRRWRLTEVNGVAVSTTKPYIEFDRGAKRFTGDGGCNRISGSFEVDGASLSFSRVVSTRRACLDGEVQRVETDFLKGLERTTGFQIQGDILRLAGGPPLLTFRADAGAASEEARVTGTVTYLQRIALPPDAVVEVRLLNISRVPAVTIAEQVIETAGRQVPVEFALQYDPRRINRRQRHSIRARILQDNKPRFISTRPYLVITGGHPDAVNVIVKPVRR